MQPILIVGAGPTGLVLALALLKSGVPVRIIDKVDSYHVSSRGAGVQPRIQEIEHFLGTLPGIQALSTPAPLLHYYDHENPRQIKRSTNMYEPMDPSPEFPISALIVVNQDLHEGVLRSHIEALGGTIELSTELSALEQDANGVTAHLTRTVDGKKAQESATFSYVIGADGGHGSVRKLLGLKFLGETYEQEKLLNVDIDLKGLEGYGVMHVFTGVPSLFLFFRSTNIPERYQLLIGGYKYAEIAQECIDAGLEEFQEIITRLTNRTDLKLLKIHVKVEWKYNVRMVNHFQKDRAFVAGDAAHAHSPMGGQGMTSSIQDAFNLAWKLALVVKGHASPALLASYEEERLPAIADMLLESSKLHRDAYGDKDEDKNVGIQSTIDALGSVAAPLAAAGSETETTKKTKEQDVTLFRGRKLFQLDLNYRWSPIVLDERFSESGMRKDAYGKADRDLRAGDRAPDAPGLVVLRRGTPLGKVSGEQGEVVRLFDIFDPAVHTALIFSSGTDASLSRDVQIALRKLPSDLVRSLLIVPQGSSTLQSAGGEEADLALSDNEGHARHGYGVKASDSAVIIVRPDGMVGAFVKSAAGVDRYFKRVFSLA